MVVELHLPPELTVRVEAWRRLQMDRVSFAEAALRLIEIGLDAQSPAAPAAPGWLVSASPGPITSIESEEVP